MVQHKKIFVHYLGVQYLEFPNTIFGISPDFVFSFNKLGDLEKIRFVFGFFPPQKSIYYFHNQPTTIKYNHIKFNCATNKPILSLIESLYVRVLTTILLCCYASLFYTQKNCKSPNFEKILLF